jgi:hypothetical protein
LHHGEELSEFEYFLSVCGWLHDHRMKTYRSINRKKNDLKLQCLFWSNGNEETISLRWKNHVLAVYNDFIMSYLRFICGEYLVFQI